MDDRKKQLIVIGGVVAAVVVTIIIIVLVFTLGKSKDDDVPSSPVPSPSPVPPPQKSPPPSSKSTFSVLRLIAAPVGATFNFTNVGSQEKGYVTYRGEKNITKWNVDIPLSYSHARIGQEKMRNPATGRLIDKIIKFTYPNSSDSSGYIIDEYGEPLNPQPPSFFASTLEFGIFYS